MQSRISLKVLNKLDVRLGRIARRYKTKLSRCLESSIFYVRMDVIFSVMGIFVPNIIMIICLIINVRN